MASEQIPEIRVGQKPVMNYVMAILATLNEPGVNKVVVKARGRNITKAIDAVEILRNRINLDLKVEKCVIGSHEVTFTDEQGQQRTRRVSSIEIYLSKE
ncbi:DNA/RNA-binding protein AlbA [Stetteria hydrogenophila]